MLLNHPHLFYVILADVLIQNDLQELLGLSALLKSTSTDFSLSQLRDSKQQPFIYWPNALNLGYLPPQVAQSLKNNV
jgi:hypothetical protein